MGKRKGTNPKEEEVLEKKKKRIDIGEYITTKPGFLYHEYFTCANFTCTELQKNQ